MTKSVFVEPLAEAELERGAAWYERERAGAGLELAYEARSCVLKLADAAAPTGHAMPGVETGLGIRRVLLDVFPYAVIYIERDDEVHVLAFAHLKRRPLYWRRRLRAAR